MVKTFPQSEGDGDNITKVKTPLRSEWVASSGLLIPCKFPKTEIQVVAFPKLTQNRSHYRVNLVE